MLEKIDKATGTAPSTMFFLTCFLGLLSHQAQGWMQPVIKANTGDVVGSDVVMNVGSRLVLTCEGDGPVTWIPRLFKHKRYIKSSGNSSTFSVEKATVDLTGTHKCVYRSSNANFSSVHLFVRDPNVLFVTSDRSMVLKEGENAVLSCLLTDPAATDVQLRMDNGTALPPGMNVTYDPKKGMQIWNAQLSNKADYVCIGKIRGVRKTSAVFSLNIVPRARFPPYVFLKSSEYVRLVGERLEISCSTHNLNFNYNITWSHSSREKLPDPEEKIKSKGDGLDIVSILTIPKVILSDSGNITCTGINEAGINSSTTQLLVVEKPYLRLTPKLPSRLSREGLSVNAPEGEDVELGVLIEAYPPLKFHGWEFPNTSEPEKRFFTHNYRHEAVLLLKRVNSRDQGKYTFYANSSMANASITFRIQTYRWMQPVMETWKMCLAQT